MVVMWAEPSSRAFMFKCYTFCALPFAHSSLYVHFKDGEDLWGGRVWHRSTLGTSSFIIPFTVTAFPLHTFRGLCTSQGHLQHSLLLTGPSATSPAPTSCAHLPSNSLLPPLLYGHICLLSAKLTSCISRLCYRVISSCGAAPSSLCMSKSSCLQNKYLYPFVSPQQAVPVCQGPCSLHCSSSPQCKLLPDASPSGVYGLCRPCKSKRQPIL